MITRSPAAALALILLAPALVGQGPPPREPYSSRCGSEIRWETDFSAAAERAKRENKPVFWYVPAAYGTKMDRRQELHWYMRGGMFADPAMVRYLNSRFVPLELSLSPLLRQRRRRGQEPPKPLVATAPRAEAKELAERYGLRLIEFIEPGFLILDAKMEKVHVMDRLCVYNSRWMLARLDRVLANAGERLEGKVDSLAAPPRSAAMKAAHEALRKGEHAAAGRAFAAIADDEAAPPEDRAEARYFSGACLHRVARTADGDAEWKRLVASSPDDRWAWKAKLELDGWGPFLRGFETYRDLSERAMASAELRTSRVGGGEAEQGAMASEALRRLLELQRENGGWEDSRYDFGGLDSLPNVHVAVSALAALALLEWRELDAERVDAAVDRAFRYLADERNTNPDDDDELAWAHVYRVHFLVALAERRPDRAEAARKKLQEVVALIEALPRRNGAFAHEYPNPFVTSSVIDALVRARKAGAKVRRALLLDAAKAVEGTRTEEGHFGYGMSTRGATAAFSSGRMPICELGLLLGERGDAERLARAIDVSFENHAILERIRKYDDHADEHGNGGFFFWYDVHGRSLAIDACAAKPERVAAWKAKNAEIVRSIHEADGGWIDSHEVGKSYGTAMGLVTLKASIAPTQ